MRIEGLNGMHQGRFVAEIKHRMCNAMNSVGMPLWTFGFDTLRLGFKKIRYLETQAKEMRKLANAVGADLIILKYFDTLKKQHVWHDSIPNDVTEIYEKVYQRPIATISNQFYHYNAVYIMRYEGILFWFLDHQKADYMTLELYGLSQPHHDRGTIKWAFFNSIMGSLPSYEKPMLLGYDFAVDVQMDFQWVVDNIAFPITLEQYNKARGKQKPDLYFHKEDEESGTVYLQPKRKNKRMDKVTIYDKQKKHGLDYRLVRIELTKTCSVNLQTIDVLNEIAKLELSDLCLRPQRVQMENVWMSDE